jgi:hypothetical protein
VTTPSGRVRPALIGPATLLLSAVLFAGTACAAPPPVTPATDAVSAGTSAVTPLPRGTGLGAVAQSPIPDTALRVAPAAVATPGQLLSAELAALRPGQTLALAPGTYPIGSVAPALTAGTSAAPITVTAADPADPPHLLGALRLISASHWTISYLHVTGTVAKTPTLWMVGGTGWTLNHDQIDGAHTTASLANLAVSSAAVPTEQDPTGWTVENSCIHGAGSPPVETAYTAIHYQNVYINAWGALHGTFAHNVIFGAPDGENLKIGDGPMEARNASDVTVVDNTSYDSSTGFIIGGHGSRGITVAHNLIVWVHTHWRPLIGIEVNRVDVPNATTVVSNYGYRLDAIVRAAGPVRVPFIDRGNIRVHLAGPGNPGFTSTTTCGGFHTTNPAVAGYGVWAGK